MALLRVGLDDRALLRCERARLEQDRVGDRDLADVVQRSGVADASAELGTHADRFGQQHGEAPDALDVRTGVLVAELDRHRQAANRLGLGDLKLGERAAQVVVAFIDLVLQRSAAVIAEQPAAGRRDGGERKRTERGQCRPADYDRRDRGDRGDRQQWGSLWRRAAVQALSIRDGGACAVGAWLLARGGTEQRAQPVWLRAALQSRRSRRIVGCAAVRPCHPAWDGLLQAHLCDFTHEKHSVLQLFVYSAGIALRLST